MSEAGACCAHFSLGAGSFPFLPVSPPCHIFPYGCFSSPPWPLLPLHTRAKPPSPSHPSAPARLFGWGWHRSVWGWGLRVCGAGQGAGGGLWLREVGWVHSAV